MLPLYQYSCPYPCLDFPYFLLSESVANLKRRKDPKTMWLHYLVKYLFFWTHCCQLSVFFCVAALQCHRQVHFFSFLIFHVRNFPSLISQRPIQLTNTAVRYEVINCTSIILHLVSEPVSSLKGSLVFGISCQFLCLILVASLSSFKRSPNKIPSCI